MNNSEQVLQIILDSIESKDILKQDCLNACGLSTTFFSDWKAGRFKNPSYDKVIKIAAYLNIDLYYLFYGETGMRSCLLDTHEVFLVDQYRRLSEFEKGKLIGELEYRNNLNNSYSEKKAL